MWEEVGFLQYYTVIMSFCSTSGPLYVHTVSDAKWSGTSVFFINTYLTLKEPSDWFDTGPGFEPGIPRIGNMARQPGRVGRVR